MVLPESPWAIDYLREENHVLREQLGRRRMRFTDDQRVRLAAKARTIGRRARTDIGTVVTPDTLSFAKTMSPLHQRDNSAQALKLGLYSVRSR